MLKFISQYLAGVFNLSTKADSSALRLLYLGFAFPPGVQPLFPDLNPAGHALETQLVGKLDSYFDIRSVGVLPLTPPSVETADAASGLKHDLILIERAPEIFHRFRSLWRLKARYCRWRAAGWQPDVVLVYNLSPIYNQFLRWLRRRPQCPKLVLLLLDSTTLGQTIPRFKQFRRRFKPMYTPDAAMLPRFDACIGLSENVGKYFRPRNVPFLWMPGGCTPSRALYETPLRNGEAGSPLVRFGYFGALGAHSGVEPLVRAFVAAGRSGDNTATLEICGYGKMDERLMGLINQHPQLKYHGLLSPAECLRFGRMCDVLVNPRPPSHGNENNFASKLFEYALTGRAILTSNLSGVQAVLGPEAYYFDAHDFASGLTAKLTEIIGTPRQELNRRGAAIQKRVVSAFSWERQGMRIAQFLEDVCAESWSKAEVAEALAA